jgi:transposase
LPDKVSWSKGSWIQSQPSDEMKESAKMLTIVGVDIAKESFTVTLLNGQGQKYRRQFANSPAGHKAFLSWLKKQSQGRVQVCLEATSIYWEEVAERLHEAGHEVSVVNPARIKGYALSQLRRSKTDPLDADVIADFCRTQPRNTGVATT